MSYETDMIYLLSELDSLKRRLQFQERLGTGLGAGWNGVSGWSYASATTINVPSGAASIYAKGDQIRLKQGGGYKYFSVVAVADTLLTVTGGSDYSVAYATITDAAFSKGGGVGHPGRFNYSPTVISQSGIIATYTINRAKFMLHGRHVSCDVYVSINDAGTGFGRARIQLPINAADADVFTGVGREVLLTGKMLQALAISNNYADFWTYDNVDTTVTGYGIMAKIDYAI